MLDMTQTTAPRSDQFNADDLVAGPQTITITRVTMHNNPQQPIHIDYEGGEGKPWKPCLTMRRILVEAWGKDGHAYVGRSVTLYRDPTVKYAGAEQGGIRISHMSHIDKKIRTMITVSRGKRVPFTVEPLQLAPANVMSAEHVANWTGEIDKANNMPELSKVAARIKEQNYADSAEKQKVLKHYQARVNVIRNESSEPESSEGEGLPGL